MTEELRESYKDMGNINEIPSKKKKRKKLSLTEDRLSKFLNVVNSSERSKEEFSILITQVDPDSVGSGAGIQRILEYLDQKASIYYCGGFGHPQNKAIANRYNLKAIMSPISKEDPGGHINSLKNIVLVDSCQGNDDRVGFKIEPIIVIDHHRGTDLRETEESFIWIEDVGSTCTMIIELAEAIESYFQRRSADQEAEIENIFSEKNKMLAVLLLLGIYTDTGALVSAGDRDRNAYGTIATYVVPEDLRQLIEYTLPASHYRNLKRAFETQTERGARLLANIGVIDESEGDDLATIADWYLRKDGISMVFVWGIINGKVRISARNSNLSDPLDDVFRDTIGSGGAKLTPAGRGHGGALIDLGPWVSETNLEVIIKMVSSRMEEWIFSGLEEEV